MPTTTLPREYRKADEHLVESLRHRARNGAWSVYEINGDADEVLVHWRTNDDKDSGVETEYADDIYTVARTEEQTAIERALSFANGGSRHGIGHAVLVQVNGEYVEKVLAI